MVSLCLLAPNHELTKFPPQFSVLELNPETHKCWAKANLRVSLNSSDWPSTHSAVQAGLEPALLLPWPSKQLRLKTCMASPYRQHCFKIMSRKSWNKCSYCTDRQFYPLYYVMCLCDRNTKNCAHNIKEAQLGHLCHRLEESRKSIKLDLECA